ncbi:PH domain-containing protein [Parafrigoribacterium mesophilum]|uniref:PH domain-containing protein n=1 Tax=Parafrigoribacterium mesophilum TaxID=433646 RepID=UPI0031FBA8A5
MNLADGQWHRLHPASPLLKGGLALVAILGVLLANLRERLFDMFVPGLPAQGDPVDYIIDNGFLGVALLVVAAVLVVLIAGFYASWRMHSFRITEEAVEVRSGILFRTNRKARLDRIQGINIVRPFFARLFGAAKVEISQAGQDANVQLSYLGSRAADGVRREILRLASGARVTAPGVLTPGPPGQSTLDRRVEEFFGPDPELGSTPAESIVTIHLGRLFGSLVLHGSTVFLVLAGIGITVWVVSSGQLYGLFLVLPGAIGFGSFYVRRFTKTLGYTIAATGDGVRVGFGLLSTTSETLPPGRIHSVRVSQPLLWRPMGWWEVSVNRASHSNTKGAAGQSNATILPVGNRSEVIRVLELLLPDLAGAAPSLGRHSSAGESPAGASAVTGAPEMTPLLRAGLTSPGGDDGFVNSPQRAVWLRPFAWRRNGFAMARGCLLLRRGGIWRQLVIVPQARLQSVSLRQGPVLRMLRLAAVHLHTVSGPIAATLGAVDAVVGVEFFTDAARAAIVSAARDTSHRWRSGEVSA